MKKMCPYCDGIGTSTECSYCDGNGLTDETKCSSCNGDGYIYKISHPDVPDIYEQVEIDYDVEDAEDIGLLAGLYIDEPDECFECSGTGMGVCPECGGTGEAEETTECSHCKGIGYTKDKLYVKAKPRGEDRSLKALLKEYFILKSSNKDMSTIEKEILEYISVDEKIYYKGHTFIKLIKTNYNQEIHQTTQKLENKNNVEKEKDGSSLTEYQQLLVIDWRAKKDNPVYEYRRIQCLKPGKHIVNIIYIYLSKDEKQILVYFKEPCLPAIFPISGLINKKSGEVIVSGEDFLNQFKYFLNSADIESIDLTPGKREIAIGAVKGIYYRNKIGRISWQIMYFKKAE